MKRWVSEGVTSESHLHTRPHPQIYGEFVNNCAQFGKLFSSRNRAKIGPGLH
jgi:hypothetical protein